MLRIKKLFLPALCVLLALTALCVFVGCSDDGNTSGSAESNGVISKESNDPVSRHASDAESSGDLGDMLSDVFSDIESGAAGLVSDAKDAASDWMSDLSDAVSDLLDGNGNVSE